MDSYGAQEEQPSSALQLKFHQLSMRYQTLLDKITPYSSVRWVASVSLVAFYCIRVYLIQGFHIISYALGIFLLNQLIGFLTPKVDPAMANSDDPGLPTRSGEEFRPFLRRLPEFKFWLTTFKGIVVAVVCTFFDALDIPVFWPILVIYFIFLFTLTMKRQIKHMIRYRYIPFSYGKPHHKGRDNSAKPDK